MVKGYSCYLYMIMETTRIDISPAIYIVLMIAVFALAL